MTHFNDRRAIEKSIPASMLYWAYKGMIDAIYKDCGEPDADERNCIDMLKAASLEPFIEIENDEKRFKRLVSKAHNACIEAMIEYSGASAGRILIMCILFTNMIAEKHDMTPVKGGMYEQAASAIIEAVNDGLIVKTHNDDGTPREKHQIEKDENANALIWSGAEKQVPKIYKRMQSLGYFK